MLQSWSYFRKPMDPNSKQKLSKLATLLSLLAIWLLSGCGFCGGADFTDDHQVRFDDLRVFVEDWLCYSSLVIP